MYLNFFQWDESQYLVNKPLKDTASMIYKKTVKMDDELKVKIAEYNTLKNHIASLDRKNT